MAKLKLLARSLLLYQTIVLITANIVIFSLDTELCRDFLTGEIGTCFTSPWEWLNQQFGSLNSVLIIVNAYLILTILAWVLSSNTLSWCLKGGKFFNIRTSIILVIGLILIIIFALRMYTTEAFRTLLWSYASAANVFVFIGIALIFARVVKRFKQSNSFVCIKDVLRMAGALLVFLLLSAYSIGLVTFSNPHVAFIILDLVLLGVLPILSSPLSVASNRAS